MLPTSTSCNPSTMFKKKNTLKTTTPARNRKALMILWSYCGHRPLSDINGTLKTQSVRPTEHSDSVVAGVSALPVASNEITKFAKRQSERSTADPRPVSVVWLVLKRRFGRSQEVRARRHDC